MRLGIIRSSVIAINRPSSVALPQRAHFTPQWRTTGSRRGSSIPARAAITVAEVVEVREKIWGVKSGGKTCQRPTIEDVVNLMYKASQQRGDRRQENEERNQKRQRMEGEGKPNLLHQGFSVEEVAQEERRPKHKVAVLIGYSGTGYRGMQM